MTASTTDLIAELREFVRQWARLKGNDPEVVYSIHADPDAEPVSLRIAQLTDLADALEAAAKDEWEYGIDYGNTIRPTLRNDPENASKWLPVGTSLMRRRKAGAWLQVGGTE